MLGKSLIKAAAGNVSGEVIEDLFQTWLYTGNGSTQTITNGIDLAGEGGLVWTKARASGGNSDWNLLFDTTRGISNYISSNSTNAASSSSGAFVTAYLSSGFTVNESFGVGINSNNTPYTSWTFRKAPGFFDIVTYTGDNTQGRAINHNLGSAPGCIIVKGINTSAGGAANWTVYHRSLGTDIIRLNLPDGAVAGPYWGAVTDTTFSPPTLAGANQSGVDYIAYLFAHDEQIFGEGGDQSVIKCGSYTEPSAGTFLGINLGWEPQWILWKRTNNPSNWYIFDTQRGWNVSGQGLGLFPDGTNAEVDYFGGTPYLFPTATGFTVRGGYFGAGSQMIYIAIRRGPMKTPTDATEVFNTVVRTGDGSVTAGFPVDFTFSDQRGATSSFPVAASRMTGPNYIITYANSPENTGGGGSPNYWQWDSNTDLTTASFFGANSNVRWMFRRAPGFFDVVAYTGTGVARTVPHNLGVAPELMIVKNRSLTGSWATYNATSGATKVLFLDLNLADTVNSSFWNNTAPTSSVFSLGNNGNVNSVGVTTIAYLFATCPGVSKVGSYTGTGTTLDIDCGFTSGARFVLIKRTDSTGDWYVWDSARGIVSGNDPYLLLNSTAAEVTSTDYIDPLSSGFQISSTAPAAINASGGSYIYLAIA